MNRKKTKFVFTLDCADKSKRLRSAAIARQTLRQVISRVEKLNHAHSDIFDGIDDVDAYIWQHAD